MSMMLDYYDGSNQTDCKLSEMNELGKSEVLGMHMCLRSLIFHLAWIIIIIIISLK